jgi:hypothetical protein
MHQEIRVFHPQTDETVVVATFPETLHDSQRAKIIEAAQELGATVVNRSTNLRTEQTHPSGHGLKSELVNVVDDQTTPAPLPYVPAERYDDEPGRGY